jgi:putative phosphoesterase
LEAKLGMKEQNRETVRRIGVVSDTHGLVRPEALAALDGSELILHAGDIGSPEVLDALRGIAPVVAVRGNNDTGAWARKLPREEVIETGALSIYLLHDLKEIDLDPAAAGFRVVVSGHSHQPSIREEDGVLFVNPGSAGPRRFTLPVSVANLKIAGVRAEAEWVALSLSTRTARSVKYRKSPRRNDR